MPNDRIGKETCLGLLRTLSNLSTNISPSLLILRVFLLVQNAFVELPPDIQAFPYP